MKRHHKAISRRPNRPQPAETFIDPLTLILREPQPQRTFHMIAYFTFGLIWDVLGKNDVVYL